MCGIVGIFDSRGRRQISKGMLARMTNSLTHRGPDGSGIHVSDGIGLGHRRLSIIDLGGGKQPLYNEDGSVAVTYNGEIYNFKELRTELLELGHTFRTVCDTEVIVHAWEEWGEACVERFRGMFAFGLWDENRETLFLARDRLGIKPLYYAVLPNGMVIFASEMKALLLHPGLSRDLDNTAIEDYFAYGYVPDPKSIYRGISKLAPGHVLTLRRGEVAAAPRAYWDVSFEERSSQSEEEIAEELIIRLGEAVNVRLMADVPLGAFLSGGVDSSGIVAMMAGLSETPVETCSISFDQPDFDESGYSSQIATRYGTRHHVQQVDTDAVDLIENLAHAYDEPFADSSAVPTFRLCAMARRYVTVALSGDGGDEIFAGYRKYRNCYYAERIRELVPGALRRPMFGVMGRLYPHMVWAPWQLRLKPHFEMVARDTEDGVFNFAAVLKDPLRHRLYSDTFRRELQGYNAVEVTRSHMRRAPSDHPLSRLQYVDLKTYLPGDILTKVDRASMANSLEVRVPILDHHFVEWAGTLPVQLKLRGFQGKHILKRALEPYVSREILYRRKMGFSMPISAWFRGPLRDRIRDAITNGVLAETGLFDLEFARLLVDQHQSGRREHGSALWSLLMFEAFLRRVHNSAAERTQSASDADYA